jgi:hypothetical protein
MEIVICLGLVLLGTLLDRAWLWARAMDRAHSFLPLFRVEDRQAQAMSDIAARTRRAEEQMRRIAFQRWER